MAENLDFKVSYVRVTDFGLETHKGEMLSSLTNEDRKEIKVLSFLPIIYNGMIDVTDYLNGFSLLETLNLPSMITVNTAKAKEKCPLLRDILMLNRNTFDQSINGNAVRVEGTEEEGENDTKLRGYVSTNKEGTLQTFVINPVHIDNHAIVIEDKTVERLSIENVSEFVSGEKGLINLIDEINSTIEDNRCHIEVNEEMLESLLFLFVEKGVTFEQFTIDFSKLYDKIESYKSITRNINQVSIKEEVENCIIETYQKLQQTTYIDMLNDSAQKISKLVIGSNDDTEDLLMADMSKFLVNLIVASPDFDEDYKSGDTVNQILNDMIISMPKNIKSSKVRDSLKKSLSKAISLLKENKEELFSKIEKCLEDKVSIEWTRDKFAEAFDLDLNRKPARNMVSKFIDKLTTKNFETLVKTDVLGIIDRVKKEMGDGEVRSKEMIAIISRVVDDFPTREEINNVLLDVVAKNGYFVINDSNA